MTASPEYKLGAAGARGLRAVPSAAVVAALGLLVPVVAWAVDAAQPAEVKAPTVNAVWVEREFSWQLDEDQSRRELVGRVQGKGGGVDAATAQFPAELRVVEFDGRRGRRVEDGDCEMLAQLLPQVLKPLGVRELPGSALRCVPKQSQFGAVRLRLESLHALPPPAPPAR